MLMYASHAAHAAMDHESHFPAAPDIGAAVQPERTSYAAGQRFSPTAAAAAIVLPALLTGALMLSGAAVSHSVKTPRLETFDLALPTAPPPSPPAAAEPTPPAVARPVAPPPIVTVPQPAPVIITQAKAPPAPPVSITVPAPAALPAAPSAGAGPAPSPPSPAVVGMSDLGVRMISGDPPRYPLESRHRREQGRVVLGLMLGLNGCVSSIAVSHSSGFDRLDDAAMRAVRRWCWSPVKRDGQSVMVKGDVEIPFILKG